MLENQDSKATENIKGDIKSNKSHAETSVLEPEYLFQCRIHKRYSKIPPCNNHVSMDHTFESNSEKKITLGSTQHQSTRVYTPEF